MAESSGVLQESLDAFLQKSVRSQFFGSIGKAQWQTVLERKADAEGRWSVFCALLPKRTVSTALASESWDLHHDEGRPGLVSSFRSGKTYTRYTRYSNPNGVEPLVTYQGFPGARESQVDICDEFRLFFNLAQDRDRGLLLGFDRSGNEIEVVRITDTKVAVAWPYLRRFLAAKRMWLALFVDSVRDSEMSIEDVPAPERLVRYSDASCCYSFVVGENRPFRAGIFSRLLGKALFPPPPRSECYGEQDAEESVKFIAGMDKNGAEILENPNLGENEDRICLTMVFFRRSVLDKYYQDPNRYEVRDGYLSCLGLWGMEIDNNRPDVVMALLGDIGRDLPYMERLHWRSHNIAHDGAMSPTNFRRSFLCEFALPSAPDLAFRSAYTRFCRAWHTRFRWHFYLQPAAGDAYLLAVVRIPALDTQRDFDDQILNLAKLLVDSLNEKRFVELVGRGREDEKGIAKLKRYLLSESFPQTKRVIDYLRILQQLRSQGSAHRKGKGYTQSLRKLGLDKGRVPEKTRALLNGALEALCLLGSHFLGPEWTPSNPDS